MAERWETRDQIIDAVARFEASVDGYVRPAAYGVGIADGESTQFRYACRGDHLLPAAVLANVCGHTSGTHAYDLTADQLDRAIALLAPAEACDEYDHPNLAAWREVSATLPDHPKGRVVAVFVADLENASSGTHEDALRGALQQ